MLKKDKIISSSFSFSTRISRYPF